MSWRMMVSLCDFLWGFGLMGFGFVDDEADETMEYDTTREGQSFVTAGSSRPNESVDESFRSAA
jgi:hypothetical protein